MIIVFNIILYIYLVLITFYLYLLYLYTNYFFTLLCTFISQKYSLSTAIRQDDAEPLTEREQLDFSSAVESVGERIVARLRSNVWSHREQGLKDL